jgi:hypothetical protein
VFRRERVRWKIAFPVLDKRLIDCFRRKERPFWLWPLVRIWPMLRFRCSVLTGATQMWFI